MAELLAASRGRSAPPPGRAHPGAASGRGGAAGSGTVGSLLPPLLLLLSLSPGAEGTPPRLCGSCAGPPSNGSVVAQYCASRAGTELWGRCCVGRGSGGQRLLGYGQRDGGRRGGNGVRVTGTVSMMTKEKDIERVHS